MAESTLRSRLQQDGSAAVAHLNFRLPFELDARDPNFPYQHASWLFEIQCQIAELVARGKETIAASNELMAKVDRVLAQR